ncbi:MAG: hypothetical protein DI586_01230 [Micavibrio aeruginosavorus]|uniref:Uncharacterized protein n=1 Tax=Micavibrio aeruginosavorus TaxID=349221 RepID=A0A2W5FTK9_9BACT|nr:MAG: hypothetical protein DI586_01230 [Micavibrio aeruginosavorus]
MDKFLGDAVHKLLMAVSPSYRHSNSDFNVILAIAFAAFVFVDIIFHGGEGKTLLLVASIIFLIFALGMRWSHNTEGIDVGNLDDSNLRDRFKQWSKLNSKAHKRGKIQSKDEYDF